MMHLTAAWCTRRRRWWRWRWRWWRRRSARTTPAAGIEMMSFRATSIRPETSAWGGRAAIMVATAESTAIEMVAKGPTPRRTTKWCRTTRRRSAMIAGRAARISVVVATVIPDRAVIAAMVPMIAMVIAVMVVIMIAVMIVIVMMVVVTEKAQAPGVEPDEAVVRIKIVVERWTEASDAGVIGAIAFPLVAPPVAADPVVVIAVYVAIVEGPAIPFAVEIDRTIG